jgi:hypothetical protein
MLETSADRKNAAKYGWRKTGGSPDEPFIPALWRFWWLPKIEPVILPSPGLPTQGGGEPAIIVMGAVVANAIDDTVDARVLQRP